MAADTYALTTLANARDYTGITEADPQLERLINAASAAIETECRRQFLTRSYTVWLDGTGARVLPLPNYPITTLTRACVGWRDAIWVRNAKLRTEAAAAIIRVTSTGLVLTLITNATTTSTLAFETYTTITTLAAAINALGNNWVATVQGGYGSFASSELRPVGGQGCLTESVPLHMAEVPENRVEIDAEAHALIHPSVWPEGYQNIYLAYTAGYATVPADLEQVCLEVVKELYDDTQADGAMQSERLGDYAYALKAQSQVREKHMRRIGPWQRIVL